MNITYIASTEVTKVEQLKEIFRDRCGIEVDGRIYTSISSITDIGFLISNAEQLSMLVRMLGIKNNFFNEN